METEYDDATVYQRNADRGAQVIQIDNGKHVTAVVVCAVVCGMSVILAVWAALMARDSITEYRILLNHYMELEAQVEALKHAQ